MDKLRKSMSRGIVGNVFILEDTMEQPVKRNNSLQINQNSLFVTENPN